MSERQTTVACPYCRVECDVPEDIDDGRYAFDCADASRCGASFFVEVSFDGREVRAIEP